MLKTSLRFVILALAAIGLNSAGAQGITKDLISKAKQEGTLTWYTSDSLSTAERLGRRFKEEFGVSIQVVRKTSLPLVQQFVTESSRGVSPADVVTIIGMGPVAGTFVNEKLLQPYVPAGAKQLPDKYKIANVAFAYTLVPMGVGYNTNLVSKEEVELLRTYKGWLDPRFKGRMAFTAPIGGSTAGNMLMIQEKEGIDFIKALREKQKATVYQTVAAVGDAVASGEVPIGLNLSPSMVGLVVKGAPVRFVLQKDWTFVVPIVSGISAKAPHVNAAKLFMEWIFTPEVQLMHSDLSYFVPTLPGVKPRYPKAEWLESPENPVTPNDSVAFDNKISSSIGEWRVILGW